MRALPHATRGALAFAAATSFVALVSCEAIVGDQVPQYTCEGTSPLACPNGMYCKGAGCVACEQVDVCDHLDNDCNGKVDDGKLCDADGDGFTWCGNLDDQGHPVDVDCDDNDPTVYPGAPEVCDGKDNDCNGKIDDGAVCAQGATCFAGQCITNPCDPTVSTSCPSGQSCDPASHTCVDNTKAGAGAGCNADAECTSPYFCVKSAVVGVSVVPSGSGGVCTSTCCSSENCPANMVCYAPGNGGRYCVDPAKLGRGNLGTLPAGSPANSADRCRSGAFVNGLCMDTCCTDNSCANGTACAFGTFDSHDGFFCQPGTGSGQQGDTCNVSTDCHDDACVDYSLLGASYCISECCGSGSCGSLLGIVPARCYYEQTTSGDYLGLCSAPTLGSSSFGQPCTASSDCASGICYTDSTGQYCSDACCVDSDCAAGYLCRPGPTFPRCVKKL